MLNLYFPGRNFSSSKEPSAFVTTPPIKVSLGIRKIEMVANSIAALVVLSITLPDSLA